MLERVPIFFRMLMNSVFKYKAMLVKCVLGNTFILINNFITNVVFFELNLY